MTLREFAQHLTEDPVYRETVRTRAIAGTLPPDLETFIWEVADGRLPAAMEPAPLPNQSKTMALIHQFPRTADQETARAEAEQKAATNRVRDTFQTKASALGARPNALDIISGKAEALFTVVDGGEAEHVQQDAAG